MISGSAKTPTTQQLQYNGVGTFNINVEVSDIFMSCNCSYIYIAVERFTLGDILLTEHFQITYLCWASAVRMQSKLYIFNNSYTHSHPNKFLTLYFSFTIECRFQIKKMQPSSGRSSLGAAGAGSHQNISDKHENIN